MNKNELHRVWVEGWEQWINYKCSQSWIPFYINIMFQKMQGDQKSVIRQMTKSIERKFYPRLLREFVSHPTKNAMEFCAPQLVLFADLPVYKSDKVFVSANLNHGLHYNGYLVVPPDAVHPQELIDGKCHVFYQDGIERIVANRISIKTVQACADYAAKTVVAQRVDQDTTIILPRARSEMKQNIPILDSEGRRLRDIKSKYHYSDSLARSIVDQ